MNSNCNCLTTVKEYIPPIMDSGNFGNTVREPWSQGRIQGGGAKMLLLCAVTPAFLLLRETNTLG